MYETLIVDGTDLATICDCIVSLDGLYQVGSPRGDNVVFPGVDGETHLERPFGTQVIELGLMLQGTTTTQFNDKFRVLKKLVTPGKLLTLQRRMSFTSGNETHTAQGEWAGGLNQSMSLMRFGRTTLQLKVLDGLWYATSTSGFSLSNGSFSANIGGEARTLRLSFQMDANSTLTNTTNGYSVTNTSPSGPVVVDNESMTATASGSDVSAYLSWTGRFPMRLEPGVNNFTYTGSVGSVAFTAAYL